jgi:hypothetical protein
MVFGSLQTIKTLQKKLTKAEINLKCQFSHSQPVSVFESYGNHFYASQEGLVLVGPCAKCVLCRKRERERERLY